MAQAASEERTFTVGDRVQSKDGKRATVRYVGDIQGATPIEGWVGVEWDDKDRGKHDGVAYGNRYFTCPSSTGASFLRPDKLDQGLSFQDVVLLKYASQQSRSANTEMTFREQAEGKAAVVVQLVGKEKLEAFMAKLKHLETITLQESGICSAGDAEWTAANLPNVTRLDLSGNLIASFDVITEITSHLPKLEALVLTGNLLTAWTPPPRPMGCLRALILNATGVTWPQVQQFSQALSDLEELHLCANGISQCSDTAPWPNLRLLNLEHNCVSQWDNVVSLGRLPSLRCLNLNDNLLTQLSPPEVGSFAQLNSLLLGGNAIGQWSSVDAVDLFPSVSDLRLKGNTLFESLGQSAARQQVVARVAKLTSLNGGVVRDRERDDAERWYIRFCVQTAPAPDKVDPALHPRFSALVDKLGAPAVDAATSAAGQRPGTGMLVVTLRSNAAASVTKPPTEKKLPSTLTVAAVKKLCEQLYRLDPAKQNIFHRHPV